MFQRIGKRGVLRAGYGVVIAVLVISAGEAYRIQAGLSRQHLEIYRGYVEQEAALSTLRRNLWLAGNDVRDFFILSTPERAAVLSSQLEALKREDDTALDYVERTLARRTVALKLRKSVGEFWRVVDDLPQTMLRASKAEQFAFLEREIVPRRGELYSALVALAAADQQRLQQSEGEFAESRRSAAERLMIMLGLSVVLSFLVARLSLRYAEALEGRAAAHFAEVERARAELQQLSARLLEVEEEGRRQLSRELHDEIGQTLALLQIEVSQAYGLLPAQPAVAQLRLARAREMAERTVQTIRNIALMLRPAILDDLGLSPALQFLVEDFERRSGIACRYAEETGGAEFPDVVNTCVYRVVQEALHNSEKHSGATRVTVTARALADRLAVEVEDNGTGFALEDGRMPPGAGLGLLGMRERAAAVGGTLAVESAPGRGTRIAVTIPIAARPAAPSNPEREVRV